MDSLNLSDYDVSHVPLEPEPGDYKSPAKAFFLSLVLPGAGQFHCDKKPRGILTFLFIVVPIVLGIYLAGEPLETANKILLGIAILLTPLVLYPFAFLDAYFTAREINAGQDYVTAPSPRVAAVLNLLTNGFGYIYIGRRRTGIFTFIALGLFFSVMQGILGPRIGATFELVPIGIAVALSTHVYRIAKRDLEKFADAPLMENPAARIEPEGLSPIVPVGLAGLFVLAYVFLIVLRLIVQSLPDYSAMDQSKANIVATEAGQRFTNPRYGVTIEIPADWTFESKTRRSWLVSASSAKGCWVTVTLHTIPLFSSFEQNCRRVCLQIGFNLRRESKPRKTIGVRGTCLHDNPNQCSCGYV